MSDAPAEPLPGLAGEWLPVRDAAAATGVSESTLRGWCRTGAVPSRLDTGPHGRRRVVAVAAVRRRAASGAARPRAAGPTRVGGAGPEAEPASALRWPLSRAPVAPGGARAEPAPSALADDLREEAEQKLAELYERLAVARRQTGRPDVPVGAPGEEPAPERRPAADAPADDEEVQADADPGAADLGTPGGDPARADAEERARRAEAEAARLRAQVEELRALSDRRLAEFDQALAELDGELRDARQRADRAEAELASLRPRREEQRDRADDPSSRTAPAENRPEQREDLRRLDAFFERRDEVARLWRARLTTANASRLRADGGRPATEPSGPLSGAPGRAVEARILAPLRFWLRRKRG